MLDERRRRRQGNNSKENNPLCSPSQLPRIPKEKKNSHICTITSCFADVHHTIPTHTHTHTVSLVDSHVTIVVKSERSASYIRATYVILALSPTTHKPTRDRPTEREPTNATQPIVCTAVDTRRHSFITLLASRHVVCYAARRRPSGPVRGILARTRIVC